MISPYLRENLLRIFRGSLSLFLSLSVYRKRAFFLRISLVLLSSRISLLISMFVFYILQIPSGCSHIFSECSTPTYTPLTTACHKQAYELRVYIFRGGIAGMFNRNDTYVCAHGVFSYIRLRPSDRHCCQCSVH